MLTKKECAAITERATESLKKGGSLYEILFGHTAPDNTTTECDNITIINRLIDLCDTSNMIELPIDKDGEVIKVGDTVYVDDDVKYKVVGYMMRGNGTEVILAAGAEPVYTKEPANNITHKKPVTIASLVKELTDIVAADYGTPMVVKRKLSDIADQLEKLGGSDD